MEKEYTVDYFIDKFNAIDSDMFCSGSLYSNGKSCALGLCGVTDYDNITNEGKTLILLFSEYYSKIESNVTEQWYKENLDQVYRINDMAYELGLTPKERIIKRLYQIKEKERLK